MADASTPEVATVPITAVDGGACASGAPGSTAFRARWVDQQGAASATLEARGLPDSAGTKLLAFAADSSSAPFGDRLDKGGVELPAGSYVEISFSTRAVPKVRTATIAIEARSADTTDYGSFSWQTAKGAGKSVSGQIRHFEYGWYTLDMTAGWIEETQGVALRIRPGPPSNALVIHRIELCLDTE